MRLLLLALLLLASASSFAQSGFPNYYRYLALAARGDSLYQQKAYRRAAETYEAANRVPVEKGIEIDPATMTYNAACTWALAKQPARALEAVRHLAYDLRFADLDRFNTDTDFQALRTDKRWPALVARIKANREAADHRAAVTKKRTTLAGVGPIFYPLTPYARQFLESDSLPFISQNDGPYRLYFSADSYAAQHLPKLRAELDDAYSRNLSVLGVNSYDRGINLVLLDSPEQMRDITGIMAQGGVALVGHDLAFLPYGTKRRPQFRHELFHLMVNATWGLYTSRMLNEGLAVYADNQCSFDNPLYGFAAYAQQHQKLLPLQNLVSDFDGEARKSDVLAYLQSAAVCKYLYEKYGIEKFRRLWVGGFEQFGAIYGMPITQLEKEWLDFIRTVPAPAPLDWDYLMKNGCG